MAVLQGRQGVAAAAYTDNKHTPTPPVTWLLSISQAWLRWPQYAAETRKYRHVSDNSYLSRTHKCWCNSE